MLEKIGDHGRIPKESFSTQFWGKHPQQDAIPYVNVDTLDEPCSPITSQLETAERESISDIP